MANCHNLFLSFHDKIKLTDSKEEDLRRARDAIRLKINNYFKDEKKEPTPNYKMQGSFSMKTAVNPLDGEYDVDDGVYLNNLNEDKDEWPTPETAHKWIYDAVDGHTKERPVDKRTCVRVIYSGQYHVDLPIYGLYQKEPYLAEKGDKGWHKSDPVSLSNWFIDEVKNRGEQLRRIVRYIKAWADFNSKNGKMPPSLILTILVTEEYESYERDDESFARVIRNINKRIKDSFVVYNPIDKNECLTERLTDEQKDFFKHKIATLLESAKRALIEEKKKDACKQWRREFGERFSCDNMEEDKEPLRTSAPAILKDDTRSA